LDLISLRIIVRAERESRGTTNRYQSAMYNPQPLRYSHFLTSIFLAFKPIKSCTPMRIAISAIETPDTSIHQRPVIHCPQRLSNFTMMPPYLTCGCCQLGAAYTKISHRSRFHRQHWWFSGKIGRCHMRSRISDDSASPGFDSRPMQRTTPRSLPFAFCLWP
jgi:hypothetical protein